VASTFQRQGFKALPALLRKPVFQLALMATACQTGMALPAMAAPTYVNSLTIPGNRQDLSGDTTIINRRFGAFSGLYYLPSVNQWFGLSDRGPGGGTLDYNTRLQRFSLDVDKTTGAISNFQIQQTILFRNGSSYLNGLAPASASNLGNSFDLVGERRRTAYKVESANSWLNETYEIKLRNHKKEAVEIRVVEHMTRFDNWELKQKSDDFLKLDSHTIEFPVTIKPDEEKILTYQVRYTW
jgi:hypothetical protein